MQTHWFSYTNQTLVEYNISCSDGKEAFIDFTKFDLEPNNCLNQCRDYIDIDAGTHGLNGEYCGNTLNNTQLIIQAGSYNSVYIPSIIILIED